LPFWAESDQVWTLNPRQGYPLLICLIGLTVANRGFAGVLHPVPRKVQLAVKHAILTLILIDAAVVLMWAGAWYGCGVVVLLLPALSSSIRFRST
jgi:4-hydroxybenzoate polyprenyltransferase